MTKDRSEQLKEKFLNRFSYHLSKCPDVNPDSLPPSFEGFTDGLETAMYFAAKRLDGSWKDENKIFGNFYAAIIKAYLKTKEELNLDICFVITDKEKEDERE